MKIVRRLAASLPALALACSAGVAPAAQAAPQPSFGIEVGNALLCLNQLNSKYFYDFLTEAFGPPYKTEGGAYWFKAPNSVTLWGLQVTDLLINDSNSQADFIGAFFNATPVKLTESISAAVGIRFTAEDNTAYPIRQSQAGSKIVYNNTNAKMYCAKSKYLVPAPQQPGP